jgi:hypothetical protein
MVEKAAQTIDTQREARFLLLALHHGLKKRTG